MTRWHAAIVATVLALATPTTSRAFFPPPVPPPEPTSTPGPSFDDMELEAPAVREERPARRQPGAHALGLSFSYLRTRQDLEISDLTVGGTPVPGANEGSSTLNAYTGRIDYWLPLQSLELPLPALNVYGLVGGVDGHTTLAGQRLTLSGTTFGGGTTVALESPDLAGLRARLAGLALHKLTLVGTVDFNYSNTKFDELETRIHEYRVAPRVGVSAMRLPCVALLYAGAQYQTFTRRQAGTVAGVPFALKSEPEQPWNALVGLRLWWFPSPTPQTDLSNLSLLVEGGLGNRQEILAQLRYEFRVP